MEQPPDVFQTGSIVADKYRVERALGAGAMGVVVLARHMELGQPVAIKFLRPELAASGEIAMRFREEARATAAIRSEHAVRVFDVSAPGVTPPFMVMERLRGTDLQALVDMGPLAVAEAVDYVLQGCAGVAAAHALGLVHRDLKPANMFVAEREGGGHIVKVLDFGIAKSVLDDSRLFRLRTTGEIKGTPAYMSPEQLETPKDIDTRSDVWALGAILCELVTGRMPFEAETVPKLCAKILMEPPATPSHLRPGLPAELDAIVLRCLQKDRAARYQTVAEVAEALAPLGGALAAERVARVRAALSRVESSTERPPESREPIEPIMVTPTAVVRPARRALPVRSLALAGACILALATAAVVVLGGRPAPATPIATAAPGVASSIPGPSAISDPSPATVASATPDVPTVQLDDLPSAPPPLPTISASAVGARPAPAREARPPARQPSSDDLEFGGRK